MTVTRVMFDHQIFSFQRYGGVSRYFFELINRLRNDREFDVTLAMGCSMNNFLRNRDFSQLFTHRNRITLELVALAERLTGRHVGHWFYDNQKVALDALEHRDFDVFHPTYFDPYFVRHLNEKPFVLTIYDMIHERFPQYFGDEDRTRVWKRELAGIARHIIAISESTKRDLMEFYGIPAQMITVIHLASSLRSPPASSEPFPGLPGRYLLFVGNRNLYKNFRYLIQALEPVFKRQSDLHLMSVGGGPFSAAEMKFIERSGLQSRILQRSASDEVLAQIYSRAVVFICPSQYEGFGIPVLEAMSCGCPTLLNRTSSLPEVGGEAAKYFDDGDEESLCQALDMVLKDPELRTRMRQEGLKQAAKFSWERMAVETKKVYQSLCT